MLDDRPQQQASALLALQGHVVRSWHGLEMAVRGDGTHFEFGGPDVPCLQLLTLRMTLDTGSTLAVTTYQDNDAFGLAHGASGNAPPEEPGTGYRSRPLPELPTGQIEDVAVHLDGDLVAEVTLRVEGQDLLLIAGEADEDQSGRLVWHRLDESVLVFPQPNDAGTMSWTPTRTPIGFVTRKRP